MDDYRRQFEELCTTREWTKDMTMADIGMPAMEAWDRQEAKMFLNRYVNFLHREFNLSAKKALDIAKKNIGFYAGYTDEQTFYRVLDLYETEHPIFGNRWPSPREAFEMGVKLGEEMKKKNSYNV